MINEGFLSKVFDFFNYKPIDDYLKQGSRKEEISEPQKGTKVLFFTKNIAYKKLLKVTR